MSRDMPERDLPHSPPVAVAPLSPEAAKFAVMDGSSNQGTSVTDRELSQTLEEVFGFSSLRPGQAEVIADVLDGHPVVTVMPTGAGKSLCYQLPAVLLGETGGVSLVVSPLIALMKDQVDVLQARGVAAVSLTSASTAAAQSEILAGIGEGKYSVIYVAPERFRSPRFVSALAAIGDRLALMAVDEAHCISEWGHDFRPDYRRLGDAVKQLAPPRLIALTATATPEVRADIGVQLSMEDARYHVHGFDRPNLHLSVERSGGPADKATRMIEKVRARDGGVALVYAATRKNAERYQKALSDAGMRASVYHAGLDDKRRHAAQDQFMNGELDVIVATNAFGMGIDKANIRVVIHADLPRSAEAYYQEAGRGGRDGLPTTCVLLFNHGDVKLQEFLIDASHPSAEQLRGLWKLLRDEPQLGHADAERLKTMLPGSPHQSTVETALRTLSKHGLLRDAGGFVEAVQPAAGDRGRLDVSALERRAHVERGKLRKMVEYAYHPRCRRQFVLEYFGDEDWLDGQRKCQGCDNCRGTGGATELSEEQTYHARAVLDLLAALPNRFGRTRLANIAVGKDDDPRLHELPERGCLRGESARYVMDLIRSLDGAGLVETSRGEYPTLKLSSRGQRVNDGREELAGFGLLTTTPARRKKRAPKARGGWESVGADGDLDPAIVERLRSLRSELAAERSVPAYVIFSNRTLTALAQERPATPDELAAINGIGPNRLEAYGEQILAALAR